MDVAYNAREQRNENPDRLADVPKKYIDRKAPIKRKRPRKLIIGIVMSYQKSWVQAKRTIPNRPNSKNLVSETQISQWRGSSTEKRRGLPTYSCYKIRYLCVLQHLHMHTHISARDSRETVQSDSPRNSQMKSLMCKRKKDRKRETGKKRGRHLYVESKMYACE